MDVPIFIICRDRVSSLQKLLDWCFKFGLTRIYLIDNDSTYAPLLDFYEDCRGSGINVMRLDSNLGNTSPWTCGAIDNLHGEYFIVTDPDIIPIETCPIDAVEKMRVALDRYPNVLKAGFSLKIDDIPDHYALKNEVMKWESQFWGAPENGYFHAPLDTTFALYRPNTPYTITPAIRLAPPYTARHLGWYMDSANPSEEDIFYSKHASPSISHWSRGELPQHLKEILSRW